jgi:hypothetical protein
LKLLYLNILFLVSLNILLLLTGFLISEITEFPVPLADIAILGALFSVIAIVTLFVFFRGQTKEPESQTFHSLVSLGLKFLLEIVLALVWFIVAKKTSLQSVLIFFVLYLALTLFSVLIMFKILKNKSL